MSGYYRHPFVLPISSRLECGLCHLVPRDPWQSVGCGHMFCKRCLEEGKFLNSDFCPVDLKETKYHKDRACGREVLALPVYCLNRSSGCAWKGRLVQLQVGAFIVYSIYGALLLTFTFVEHLIVEMM